MSNDLGIISWLETMAIPFSFKYSIDMEEYSEYSHKAFVVGGAVKTEALAGCNARRRGTI